MFQRRYKLSNLDSIEDVELYGPGGLHPVLIGDLFANGRYKVLHKLGYGGSSTVWLARDQRPPSSASDTLVALKILSAAQSSRPKDEIADIVVPAALYSFAVTHHNPARHHILPVMDRFTVDGPNGTHLCIISQFAGPSLLSMSNLGWNKRLRGDLARKVAKQVATVVEFMHSAGLVHGDMTPRNILFQITDQARRWSDSEVYRVLGELKTGRIEALNGSLPGPQAPRELVAPVDTGVRSFLPYLEENIVVIDFGQSFAINAPPNGYNAGTAIHYFSPEARFDDVVRTASDIWGLACAIFEIRAGRPLFNPFMASNTSVLVDTALTLGKLPGPWWNAFKGRHECFEENGELKPPHKMYPIRARLEKIGVDDMWSTDDGPMIEPVGTQLEEEEIVLLNDLLKMMLKYRPEERMSIEEVVRHPWFNYISVKPTALLRKDWVKREIPVIRRKLKMKIPTNR